MLDSRRVSHVGNFDQVTRCISLLLSDKISYHFKTEALEDHEDSPKLLIFSQEAVLEFGL